MPSANFLSAYSVITIEPSIVIPIEINMPNMTMKLNSLPNISRTNKAKRYEKGIAIPTSIEVLKPKAARTTIITKATEVKTLPCNSVIIWRANSESSLTKSTSTPSGKSSENSRTNFLTSATVSMIFVPSLLVMSIDNDCLPLILE